MEPSTSVQLVFLVLGLVIALVSLFVAFLALFRKNGDPDVEELAGAVASLRKSHRAEQMRRVRAQAAEAPPDVAPDDAPGIQPIGHPPTLTKEEARRIALGLQSQPTRRH